MSYYSDEPQVPTMGGGAGPLGALISVGAGLYDSYQNRKTSVQNTKRTIAAQKAEAELAYQRSVQMWHMQNMYNTPQAQMQRFIEADLNPHLIYGQGSSGLASSPPQYQPANLQYRYEAPQYGAAFQSILPTLMAVGTWMQNMRTSEVDIAKKTTEADRARQLMEYLAEANPKLLQQLDNKLSLYPYQYNMQRMQADITREKLFELEQDFRFKYGEDLFANLGSAFEGKRSEIGGMKRLQYLQQESKTRLEQARASWSDFDITNPQAIMQLVLSGVMGLAGQTLRLSTHRPQGRTLPRERPRGLNRRIMSRNHPDR